MVSRPGFLNLLLEGRPNAHYLEVGVSEGETFFAVKAAHKVAVDPHFRFDVVEASRQNTEAQFHATTSDEFFQKIVQLDEKFDIIYLDGLHTFEQTLRDFTNSLEHLAQDGVVVIDDVIPTSYQAALPDQLDAFLVKNWTADSDASWMGDTYKLVFFIETFLPAYQIRTIKDNHGQAVVWKAKSRRSPLKEFSMKEISHLEFLDVIRHENIFHKELSTDIVNEIAVEKNSN